LAPGKNGALLLSCGPFPRIPWKFNYLENQYYVYISRILICWRSNLFLISMHTALFGDWLNFNYCAAHPNVIRITLGPWWIEVSNLRLSHQSIWKIARSEFDVFIKSSAPWPKQKQCSRNIHHAPAAENCSSSTANWCAPFSSLLSSSSLQRRQRGKNKSANFEIRVLWEDDESRCSLIKIEYFLLLFERKGFWSHFFYFLTILFETKNYLQTGIWQKF